MRILILVAMLLCSATFAQTLPDTTQIPGPHQVWEETVPIEFQNPIKISPTKLFRWHCFDTQAYASWHGEWTSDSIAVKKIVDYMKIESSDICGIQDSACEMPCFLPLSRADSFELVKAEWFAKREIILEVAKLADSIATAVFKTMPMKITQLDSINGMIFWRRDTTVASLQLKQWGTKLSGELLFTPDAVSVSYGDAKIYIVPSYVSAIVNGSAQHLLVKGSHYEFYQDKYKTFSNEDWEALNDFLTAFQE